MAGVDASLRRLRTDYIDLYQVHCWDDVTPLEETLGTLHMLVQRGKVRYIGASNHSGWQLQQAVDLSKHNHWEPYTCLQPQYNLLCRSTEWELVPVCLREGLGIIPWSPLRGGWLSGKYRRDMQAPPQGTRVAIAEERGWSESWSAYNNERTWQIVDTLLDVAKEIGREPAQVAINWLLRKPGVTAPIIGARNLEQLESNLGAAGWALDEAQAARLDEVSDPGQPYPYDFISGATRRR
jgi:aryl-alcohol dehydrogenase-like predicted oxidoreductase